MGVGGREREGDDNTILLLPGWMVIVYTDWGFLLCLNRLIDSID